MSPHKILGEKQWPHGHCRFWHCLQITSQKWLQSAKHWICQENVVVTELCPLSLQCKGGSNHTDMGLQRALSERKDRRPFFSHPHQLSRMACYFKPHAPWDHGEPTRIRTDMWNIFSLCAQPLERHALPLHRGTAMGHCDFLWLTFGYVAHAESLKWYSLSANFEKLMFLPPTSIRVHTIAVCQSSPLIAWLHHFFTSFGMGQGQGQAVSSTHTSKTWFWIWDLIEWYWVI